MGVSVVNSSSVLVSLLRLGSSQEQIARAAWLLGTCQVGQLVRRPGGPERRRGPLAREGGLSSDNLFAGTTTVPSYSLLMNTYIR